MDEYKGIKRDKYPSWSGWYWLDIYCKNKDDAILENDIVLQSKVKRFYLKKRLKIIIINVAVWVGLAYAIDYLIKG